MAFSDFFQGCPHLYSSYPDNNCAALFGGTVINPQDVFPNYLDHYAQFAGTNIVKAYLNRYENALLAPELNLIFFEQH